MKDKNLTNNYSLLSLEELTNEANKMIEYLEGQKDLENSLENYQNLLKLNNIIEKKFQKNIKNINEKTKEKISKITLKNKDNAKTTK
ncbi:exonuclease VII small subunit [Pelagibacterales bacterium SAG-MED01]|nr:exonuclease VII small subunit [Pelagibacterales bacterium SAG-MED01]